jgi:hypothetical protein
MGGPKKTLALQYAKQCRCQLAAPASIPIKSLKCNNFNHGRRSGEAVQGGKLPIYCAVQRKQRHHPTSCSGELGKSAGSSIAQAGAKTRVRAPGF